ncbi:phosphotransferase [Streptomyces sp. P17]|uniref:phosphotransferase n=1 Tax=Streptomyces sp. P17 TaxID=3074716 RepID=UPI0028F3FEF9|nr:phosphotransferase [Streptomyces sp. P17]MDT9700323.1 phosphotransferase [Streptomyces sp. P17]
MGVLLRRPHDLEPPPFSLPPLQPFDKVAQRLKRAAIPDATRAFLRPMADDLAAEYRRLQFALPAGHLHGDFNVGNVLRDEAEPSKGHRPGRVRYGPPRVGPHADRHVLRQLRLGHRGPSTPISLPRTGSTCGNGPGTPFSGAFANC